MVIPACGFDSAFDGAFGFAGAGFEEVECPVPQGGEILGGVAGAGAAWVFAEDDVEHPVELVLDAPVAADGSREFLRIQFEAAQVVAAPGAGFPVEIAHGLDHRGGGGD